MSRNSSRGFSLSPVQRRACIVILCCILAVLVSFVGAWVLLPKLLEGGEEDTYDPALYPVDTSLGAVLQPGAEAGDYMNGTVFVGDQNTVAMHNAGLLTLDQFVGAQGLPLSELLRQPCVCFSNDGTTYTVPAAIVKMKPRRLVVTIGSNDIAAGKTADSVIADYRQALGQIANAYPYCDIIVNAVPPVAASSQDAADRQTAIDQVNQALAQLCEESGSYKFLNSSETLKTNTGYAEEGYLDGSGVLNAAGGNALMQYFRGHPYITDDRRPDTNDIPLRAEQPTANASAEPTATPQPLKASYTVDDASHGTLTTTYENGQSGQTRLDLAVPELTTVTVEAIPVQGWSFSRWSDGQTSNPRVDVVSKDINVTAEFIDAHVSVTVDRGDTSMNVGDTIVITASVTLGGQAYTDASVMRWVINDDYPAPNDAYDYSGEESFQFSFTPKQAGTYVILAGAEINGGQDRKTVTVTVTAPATPPPTVIELSGTTSLGAGTATTLYANVQNGSGQTTWSCDGTTWTAVGSQVQFTAPNEAGAYTVRARNNGVEATLTVNVTAAPAPEPPTDQEGSEGG